MATALTSGRSATTAALLALGVAACTPQGDPALGSGFRDDFERAQLGTAWRSTGGPWEIRNGKLHVRGARNKPLWLRRVLPRSVRIEVDVQSDSDDGDIKVEVFGDGVSRAEQASYRATSYVLVHGGWSNTVSIIARMDEHGNDRRERRGSPVERGRRYRWVIERRPGSNALTWAIDGQPFLRIDDGDPLFGAGHDHFAFNNWETELWFDNLVVRPLR
ncbi:MAG: hypothetical protein IT379_35825 [Deltaproteobacteria bacterium]|nr:hypothetical protein [Deltaproteobacteria bacterium]